MLHRRIALCGYGNFAASLCYLAFIFAFVSAPVRLGLRHVGELGAPGVFADFVTCVARTTAFDLCVKCAAGTAFASGWLKRACERGEKSGRTVRALAKTELDVGNQISGRSLQRLNTICESQGNLRLL